MAGRTTKTEAVVLRSFRLGEADRAARVEFKGQRNGHDS